MAFFDFLTDAFTGRPAQQYGQQALAAGQNLAGNTQATANAATAGTQAAAANLPSQVATYFDTTTLPRVEGAYAPLSGLAQSYQPQIDQYYKMLAGGPNAGLDQFQQSPGFAFQLNKGVDALTRAGNTGGAGVGGNVLRAAQDYGSNLAKGDFYNWVNSIYQPYAGRLGGFVPAQAGILGNVANSLGNYYSGAGNTVANAYGQGAGLTAGANRDLASLTAGNNASLANLAKDVYSGQASAQQQGSSNFWNAALGAGKIAAGAGMFGGGGLSPGGIGGSFTPGTTFGSAPGVTQGGITSPWVNPDSRYG